MKTLFVTPFFVLCALLAAASVTVTDKSISLSSGSALMELSRDNGGITAFTQKGMGQSICISSGPGLWSAELSKGRMDASQFGATNQLNKFSFAQKGDDAVDLIYESQELKVVVHVKEIAGGFEFSATMTPWSQVLKSLDLPAKLSFDPQIVERFISPADPDQSVGIAFNKKFFSEQPLDNPTGWRGQSVGSKAFVSLYGKGALSMDERKPAVKLNVTAEGVQWLPADLVKKINSAVAPVVRPTPKELCDLTLVDSGNGAFFSGSRLGGEGGYIWRIGDGVRQDDEAAHVQSLVLATVRKMMEAAPVEKREIALLDLKNGPDSGFWSIIEVGAWRAQLMKLASESDERFSFASLTSLSELKMALASQNCLCIINPYGEGFPAKDQAALVESMGALKKFVHSGGSWFETGGYSFYQILQPNRFLRYQMEYPAAYADLFHLKSTAGDVALYRAQPRSSGEPWQAAALPEKIFIPGKLYCGGDGSGGYMGRSFTTWVQPKQSWTTPDVHITAGVPLDKTIADYCLRNSITKPLENKINAATFAKFKLAPLIYLAGPCREKAAALDSLPVPSLIHFADYLHGGFDKQYPDHLPPNKDFGTMDEFKSFVTALHAKGHLFSPYTNPTWWCDDPKGPTFEREGTAPLLVKADQKTRFEDYNGKTGWTTTLWHPAVQKINREVVREFIEDVPVDMLFQDQCGARGFMYDFNPAAPTPYAYSEGMISMNDEDSRRVPLGTEQGWDRVSNYQTMLCGMSWGIVPTQGGPSWRKCFKKTIPAETWAIYPLAQAISHDKCIFGHHDLGQFVTDNRSLAWTLALGYHLSWRGNADFAGHEPSREWYAWICRIQRSIGARYTGQPLTGFSHDRTPMLEREIDHSDYNDDGVITARYGDVEIAANLGPVERIVDGKALAPYGFYAVAPGMTAGILAASGDITEGGFVVEHKLDQTDLWLYAAPGEKVRVPLALNGSHQIVFDGEAPLPIAVETGLAEISVPAPKKPAPRIEPPVEETRRAPCNRPGERPTIGVISLDKGVYPSWAKVTPVEWVDAINRSSLVTLHGLKVEQITEWPQLEKILKEGSGRCMAIINPYGERILTEKKGSWKQTLDLIRGYVNNGGSWWETGGYSFHQEVFLAGDKWLSSSVGPEAASYLGLQVLSGDLDIVPEKIRVARGGESWMGKPFTKILNRKYAQVNRAMPLRGSMPVTPLVQSDEQLYVAGYRLGGWGHLWRIGGMNPERGFATSVVIAATLHQYINPPEPVKLPGTPRLWHAVFE